jgi:hypothetical protein
VHACLLWRGSKLRGLAIWVAPNHLCMTPPCSRTSPTCAESMVAINAIKDLSEKSSLQFL